MGLKSNKLHFVFDIKQPTRLNIQYEYVTINYGKSISLIH